MMFLFKGAESVLCPRVMEAELRRVLTKRQHCSAYKFNLTYTQCEETFLPTVNFDNLSLWFS